MGRCSWLGALMVAACTPKDSTAPASDSSTPTTDTEPTVTDTVDTAPPEPTGIPEWGTNPVVVRIADHADALDVPRDLEFHPDHPDQLFVVNRATDSVTVLFDPGTAAQAVGVYDDAYGNHFMEEVSSFAFGEETDVPGGAPVSSFASCQESRNTYDGVASPNDFMGPALWPGDLDVLAQVHQNDALLGSHLDMLHQTSYCMGIAHDHANAYWVFDGQDSQIVYYDFEMPHGYGEEDHSDGIVRHYPDADVLRVEDVPSHLLLDPDSGRLYIADTGNGRVRYLDTTTGTVAADLPLFSNGEVLAEHVIMGDVKVKLLVHGLAEPSGLALHDGHLFVSDHATGEIIAYDLDGNELQRVSLPDGPGVMGLAIGPDGTVWYADGDHQIVGHIEPGY